MHDPKSAASFLITRAKSLQLHYNHHNHSITSTSRFRPSLSSFYVPQSFLAKGLFSNFYGPKQFSDDDEYDYECDFQTHLQASSTAANVDELKWKLLSNLLIPEIVPRDEKVKRDYEQIANGACLKQIKKAKLAGSKERIANLSKIMGLYSEISGEVDVASKVPLPNYQLDLKLDDKLLQREGFTYPVRAHFLEDVLEMTGYKLTSFNQIDDLKNLWKTQKAPRKRKNQITALDEEAPKFECMGFDLIEAILCHICRKERPGAVLVFLTGWEDISCLRDQLIEHPLLGDPNWVLLQTCHGSMATSDQKLIFEKAPPNVRKIVLATNVAEASITIKDVVFVIDCGRAKERTYDALNNTPCLLPSWISQASARQRRGRAGRVQPGECYHLYPKWAYKAFSKYQLPELLRMPLNSLCLQIKSLQIESIGEFLSSALQAPEPQAVQNAIDFLKMIGALDEKENLTNLGKFLSVLPVDPKLGKMLIMGAIFRCFDPVLTIVAGLSGRDPFFFPQNKSDISKTSPQLEGKAKSNFAAKDYSDHMALFRAYEGWKDAEREGSAYEYCWRNFLSAQTLQAIHSLRNQFGLILKEAGLVDSDASINNELSHNQSLVRAIICSGFFPGIASVVHGNISTPFKTMDNCRVLLSAHSVNAPQSETIPYPWLVFGEKVKVKDVFICDSTGVSDSILILFGGALSNGVQAGHLKMLNGYINFFLDPNLADCYLKLKEELDKLIQKKLEDPNIDIHKEGKYLMLAVQELVSGDKCEGRFVFGHEK